MMQAAGQRPEVVSCHLSSHWGSVKTVEHLRFWMSHETSLWPQMQGEHGRALWSIEPIRGDPHHFSCLEDKAISTTDSKSFETFQSSVDSPVRRFFRHADIVHKKMVLNDGSPIIPAKGPR